ncbi:hypothetical protein CY35_12G016700 [Sphagnum magellanicum]|nr:hypothetical protein CY35_12G016700 [Sphagnum magellanicum]
MTKARRGQLEKAELFTALVACRVCGLRWRRRRGEKRREGEPTRAGGRCAPQALLSRSCCYGSVSLPIFRFLQTTEHRGFSSKQFSFFAQQLFRESPSRALGGSVSGVFFLSFAMLFFVMDRLPQEHVEWK